MCTKVRLLSKHRLLGLSTLTMALVATGFVTASCDEDSIKVSGFVRNKAGDGIANTVVSAYGPDGLLKDTLTDDDGNYSLSVPAGNTITRIVYDHPKWHVRVVEELSGKKGDNDTINKVLLDPRGPKTFALIVDQIMIYDRLRIIEQYQGIEQKNGAQQREKLRQLRSKYGERILSIPHSLRYGQQLRTRLGTLPMMEDEQRKVIDNLTPLEREVVDRLMGDLLWRYGYTPEPIYPRPAP